MYVNLIITKAVYISAFPGLLINTVCFANFNTIKTQIRQRVGIRSLRAWVHTGVYASVSLIQQSVTPIA